MTECVAALTIVPLAEINAHLRKPSNDTFLKWFTAREHAYCRPKRYPAEHYASRLAAKKACFKVLGLAVDPAQFSRIEIVRLPGGRPVLKVAPRLLTSRKLRPGTRFELSMAHERDAAIAYVVMDPCV